MKSQRACPHVVRSRLGIELYQQQPRTLPASGECPKGYRSAYREECERVDDTPLTDAVGEEREMEETSNLPRWSVQDFPLQRSN